MRQRHGIQDALREGMGILARNPVSALAMLLASALTREGLEYFEASDGISRYLPDTPLAYLVRLPLFIATIWLSVGLVLASLRGVRDSKLKVADIYSGGPWLGKQIGVYLLIAPLILISFLLYFLLFYALAMFDLNVMKHEGFIPMLADGLQRGPIAVVLLAALMVVAILVLLALTWGMLAFASMVIVDRNRSSSDALTCSLLLARVAPIQVIALVTMRFAACRLLGIIPILGPSAVDVLFTLAFAVVYRELVRRIEVEKPGAFGAPGFLEYDASGPAAMCQQDEPVLVWSSAKDTP